MAEEKETGFAEAMAQALLLKLSTHNIFPNKIDYEDHCILKFSGIAQYYFNIYENGCVSFRIGWNTTPISESSIVFLNPEHIFNRIMNIVLFVDSLKEHMACADVDWIAYGAKKCMDGNKIIHEEKWRKEDILSASYIDYRLKEHFKQEYVCTFYEGE